MHVLASLVLRSGDRDRLVVLAQGGATDSRTLRARIILMAAEGVPNTAIAATLHCSRPTVALWRRRYRRDGLTGLADLPRTGRPPTVSESVVLAATMLSPPAPHGEQAAFPHWSARGLASTLGVSPHSIRRVWRRWQITDRLSAIPLVPTIPLDVCRLVGIFLGPPELCIAVIRTGRIHTWRDIPDTARPAAANSTTDSSAYQQIMRALRRQHQGIGDAWQLLGHRAEFLSFAEDMCAAHPEKTVHLIRPTEFIIDPPEFIRTRLADGRLRIHRPPPTVSWLDAVELLTALIATNECGPAAFIDAAILRDQLDDFIQSWAPDHRPFRWSAPNGQH